MKLKNPDTRSTKEWVGKDADDWPPPQAVQLRVLLRQDGKCAITGHVFRPGDKKALDHKIALKDGGENREGNLQWLLETLAHRPKTAAENAARAPVTARAKTHAGLEKSGRVQKVLGNPDALKSRDRPKHEGRPSLPPRALYR